MAKLSVFVLLLALAGIAGGLVYVAVWDIPPPSRTVEKALPDEALQH